MKTLLQFFSFCLALVLSLPIFGQSPAPFEGKVPTNILDWEFSNPSTEQSLTVSARGEVDPELAALLQYTLDSMLQELDMIGVGAALRLPGGDIWGGGSGYSTNDQVVDPMTENHRVAIGSVSKTFTAACILSLYDEGLLDLEDSLHQYLPTYENIDSTATIRQLLQHTTGIYNYTNNVAFFPVISANPAAVDSIWAAPAIFESFVLAPDFAPGEGWNYSNTGFVILGEIIKTITGNEYYDEIRIRFIEPLGLETVFHPPFDTWQQPTAHLWADFDNDGILEDNNDLFENFNSLYSTAGAAGSYFGTPSDMAEWIYQLYGGDILTPSTVAEMKQPMPISPLFGHGLGTMRRSFLGKTAYGHGGDIFYAAGIYYIPSEDVGIAVQTNNEPTASFDLDPIIRALLDAYFNFEPTTPTFTVYEQPTFIVSPNPVHSEVRIEYEAPKNTAVYISVFNTVGQEVKDFGLIEKPDSHMINWETDDLPSGSYFVRFEVGGEVYLKKLVKM
jgi:D-alanyl-D-alanine carboxypeptidase